MGFLQEAALMEACSAAVLSSDEPMSKHIAISRIFANETIPMKFKLSICSLWLDFACIRCTNDLCISTSDQVSSSLSSSTSNRTIANQPKPQDEAQPRAPIFGSCLPNPPPHTNTYQTITQSSPLRPPKLTSLRIRPADIPLLIHHPYPRAWSQPTQGRQTNKFVSFAYTILLSVPTQPLTSTSPQQ